MRSARDEVQRVRRRRRAATVGVDRAAPRRARRSRDRARRADRRAAECRRGDRPVRPAPTAARAASASTPASVPTSGTGVGLASRQARAIASRRCVALTARWSRAVGRLLRVRADAPSDDAARSVVSASESATSRGPRDAHHDIIRVVHASAFSAARFAFRFRFGVSHQTILVLDFGSQYTQLIARRLRELSVYSEIVPFNTPLETLRAKDPAGIILSGGPKSVSEAGAPKCDAGSLRARRAGARHLLRHAADDRRARRRGAPLGPSRVRPCAWCT